MTDEIRDAILFQSETMGIRQNEVAANCKTSTATVYNCCLFFKAAKSGGFEAVMEILNRGGDPGTPLVMWALKRAQITLTKEQNEELKALMTKKRMRVNKNKKTIKEEVPPNVEVVVKEEPQAEKNNDVVAFMKLVQEMEVLTNQNKVIIETLRTGFEQIADAIAALASDVKDNANLNSDLVCERLKEQTDILNGIKVNTRKKGL